MAARAEMDDTLSMAFLVLLESLSPLERAAFLLHDVFGYEYAEIAPILERREDNCRQLVARARRAVEARRPRFDPEPERRDELAERFLAACEQGDTSGLIELLAEDVVLYGDGGGKAPALPRPLQGAEGVARAFAGFVRTAARFGVRTEPVHVNGQPGARFVDEQGRLAGVFTLDVAGGRIHAIRSLVNPDKLAHLGPLTDLQELLRARRAR